MSAPTAPATDASLTSKDYYFDSYAHFGKFLYAYLFIATRSNSKVYNF
jgi:hypothetical protein